MNQPSLISLTSLEFLLEKDMNQSCVAVTNVREVCGISYESRLALRLLIFALSLEVRSAMRI